MGIVPIPARGFGINPFKIPPNPNFPFQHPEKPGILFSRVELPVLLRQEFPSGKIPVSSEVLEMLESGGLWDFWPLLDIPVDLSYGYFITCGYTVEIPILYCPKCFPKYFLLLFLFFATRSHKLQPIPCFYNAQNHLECFPFCF